MVAPNFSNYTMPTEKNRSGDAICVTFAIPCEKEKAERICRLFLDAAPFKFIEFGTKHFVWMHRKSQTSQRIVELSFQVKAIKQTGVTIRSTASSKFDNLNCKLDLYYLRTSILAFAAAFEPAKTDPVSKAENPYTHPLMLLRLSHHTDKEVRLAVADNPSSPRLALMRLSRDRDPDIRYAMAENHNIWPPIIRQLTMDENPYVQSRASRTFERIAELAGAETAYH